MFNLDRWREILDTLGQTTNPVRISRVEEPLLARAIDAARRSRYADAR